MSIPVVEIEHRKECPLSCIWTSSYRGCADGYTVGSCPRCVCSPDCPACAVEKNNKAWAQYLVGRPPFLKAVIDGVPVIPAADWQAIKQLAEEETHG